MSVQRFIFLETTHKEHCNVSLTTLRHTHGENRACEGVRGECRTRLAQSEVPLRGYTTYGCEHGSLMTGDEVRTIAGEPPYQGTAACGYSRRAGGDHCAWAVVATDKDLG